MKLPRGVFLQVLLAIVVLLQGCRNHPRSDSFESLNSVQVRGAPLWMPTLPNYKVQITNAYWFQRVPFNVDTLGFHISIIAQKDSVRGEVDQYQVVVQDINHSKTANPRFWDGFGGGEPEHLAQLDSGYWLNKEKHRGWVKLGNVWLMISGDAWLVELLAKHYITQYNQRVKAVRAAEKELGPDTEKALGFLYKYVETRSVK